MSKLLKYYIAIMGVFIAPRLMAQDHENFWFRATITTPINDKVKLDNEFQYRRQNGFENNNMFDKDLMISYRNWIHYQYNEAFKFSLSPFSYFSAFKIINQQSDELAAPNKEIRSSAAVDFHNTIHNKWVFISRSAFEYRIFLNQSSNIIRFRSRVGLQYVLNKHQKLSIHDEPLLNLSGVADGHIFDHNRIGINLESKMLENLKVDVGYMRISRLPLNNTTCVKENNLTLSLNYLMPSF